MALPKTRNKQIEELKNERRPIFIYGDNVINYEFIKVLVRENIEVEGLIVPVIEAKRDESRYGIKLWTTEEVIDIYKNNCVFVMTKWDYFLSGRMLAERGSVLSKNIVINGYSKNRFIMRSFKIRVHILYCKVLTKIRNLCQVLGDVVKISYGKKIYRRICKQYNVGEKIVLNYDYSGLGDVFVFMLLLNENRVFENNYVVTVRGRGCKRICELFGYKDVIVLNESESRALAIFGRFCGDIYNIRNITPFPEHYYTEALRKGLAGRRLNMLEVYKYEMFELPADTIPHYPPNKYDVELVREIFEKHGLQNGKTIIISPYANTVIGYPDSFWRKITEELKRNGFSVATNCGPQEKPIEGTVKLSVSFENIEEVMNRAGYFIGIRSGFCDIISNSTCKKVIIYPQYSIFNSDVYRFCSFKLMGIGQNFTEIRWGYENLDKLIDVIMKKLYDEIPLS